MQRGRVSGTDDLHAEGLSGALRAKNDLQREAEQMGGGAGMSPLSGASAQGHRQGPIVHSPHCCSGASLRFCGDRSSKQPSFWFMTKRHQDSACVIRRRKVEKDSALRDYA